MAHRNGYILLTLVFAQEGDQWTAECQELGTTTCGDSLEDTRESIEEMIALHLNALEEVGEAERFFEKHGIEFHRGRPPRGPVPVDLRLGQLGERRAERIPVGVSR